MLQLPRGPLEQQSPAEGAGRLAEGGRDQPVEVVPAQVRTRGKLVARRTIIEVVEQQVDERPESVVAGRDRHARIIAAGAPARMIGIAEVQPERVGEERQADGVVDHARERRSHAPLIQDHQGLAEPEMPLGPVRTLAERPLQRVPLRLQGGPVEIAEADRGEFRPRQGEA